MRCTTWQQGDFNPALLSESASWQPDSIVLEKEYVAHTASMDVIATRFDVNLTNVRIDHSSAPGN